MKIPLGSQRPQRTCPLSNNQQQALTMINPSDTLRTLTDWEVVLRPSLNRRSMGHTKSLGFSTALTLSILGGGFLTMMNPKLWFPIMALTAIPTVATVGGILQAREEIDSADRIIQGILKARSAPPQSPPSPVDPTPLAIPRLTPATALAEPSGGLLGIPNPAKDLGMHPQSALIGGVPGSGKTLFTLEALHYLGLSHPEVKVIYLDPKGSDVESLQLESGVVETRPLSKMDSEAGADWIFGVIERFQGLAGPKLLVIDELASVVRVARSTKRHAALIDFMTFITSMGDSEKAWVWLLTQDASCEGIGMNSNMRANLRAIALISPKNRNALQAFLSGAWVPTPPDGRAGLDALMESSPTGRAVFDGKIAAWAHLPRMTNRTGNDRDSPSPRNHQPTVQSPSPSASHEPSDSPVMTAHETLILGWMETKGLTQTTVRDITRNGPTALRKVGADRMKEILGGLAASFPARFKWDGAQFSMTTVSTPLPTT